MNILMITSEAVPFAKSGGLADMVSALSIALKEEGQDVRILMPLYDTVSRKNLSFIADFQIDMVNRREQAALYRSETENSGIPVYFLESEKYFNRKGIYGPTPASSYPDNAHRYSLLSAAFPVVCKLLDWIPHILHSHDWPTGLVPLYLKKAGRPFDRTATVFTIHNMGYQGTYDKRDLPWTGLSAEETHDFNMMKDGYLNYLKTGIENHTRITTVSPTYSQEIRTLAYGHGLDQSLNHRASSLTGILNGVDYSSWNPETDRYLAPDYYSVFDLDGKKQCKTRLQMKMRLDEKAEVPLFAMITRLVSQKGIEELCRPGYGILEEFCREQNVQVVILGTGEAWVEEELKKLSTRLPNLSVKITYNEQLSHLIEGGADFFIMPSHYEPCGLNQLYSLKYGTIPIVRKTGGLADSVLDPSEPGGWKKGTGFVYEEADPRQLREVLDRAVECWEEQPDKIRLLRHNGMNCDFSWKPSALAYMQVYEEALGDL
ncbi:MAG: glycogen synthase GlgA [Spirochaetales bacterium]|nr:glycogen synthase GlgA [Spirochaetales bacterium]